MRILRARFENFRLLRDLELDFSTDHNKRLTVIRAENESGKTTILTALQWGLYGDDALPGRASDFRLHPIDWDATGGESITISVEIDFEIVKMRRSRTEGLIPQASYYRIIRSADESLSLSGNTWERSPSTISLFRLEDTGSEPADYPEATINQELPPELREVFFTDGDRALNFIEADTRDKRDRVQRAIRSLLGLDIIEESLSHVHNVRIDINRQAEKIDLGSELQKVAARLEQVTAQSVQLESEISDAKDQSNVFGEKILDLQKNIDEALVKGDKEELQQEFQKAKAQLEHTDTEIDAAAGDHAQLLRSLALSRDLLEPILRDSISKLDDLREQGKLFKADVPILEECLSAATCICGESLAEHHPQGMRRREHIKHLIEQSQESDDLHRSLSDLHTASTLLQLDRAIETESWTSKYKRVAVRRDRLEQDRKDRASELGALDVRIARLPDADIKELRKARQNYERQRNRFHREQMRKEEQLKTLQRRKNTLTAHRDRLLREQKKGARILANLSVTKDVESVLRNSCDRITIEELKKVSALTNTFFLEMIGSDPEQGTLIQRAEISPEFDILVYGPEDKTLDPDRDLNGASRRALTLAFILALTKVSGVEAPNVIDTPLGMMSGYVKRSVLRTAIRESHQLVMFLTRSEIEDCEEILDTAAGQVITLTNSAHYPTILKNDPQVSFGTILRCECDHRSRGCQLCERHDDPIAGMEAVT